MELLTTFDGLGDKIRTLVFHNNILFGGTADIRGFDVHQQTQTHRFQEKDGGGHNDAIYSLAIIANDDVLISGSADKCVKVWDLTTNKCTKTLAGHTDIVRAVTYNDGIIYTGGFDHSIRAWDTRTWMIIHVIKPEMGNINSLLWHGNCLYVAGGNGTIKGYIWDKKILREHIVMRGHKSEVTSLSCYDNIIVSGSTDSHIKLWNTNKHVCMNSQSHMSTVSCVLASKPTQQIYSGGADLKVWDMESMYTTQTASNHTAPIRSLAMYNNSDTHILASGSQDKSIKLWRIEPIVLYE